MRNGPLTRQNTGKSGRYFERAEFDSNLPIHFLITIVGLVIVVFEGSLALWPFFYGATPMLSLIFLYWLSLHFEKFTPMFAAFMIGITSDILFSDLLGGRAIAYMLVLYVLQYRRPRLLQSEFMEIWTDFAIVAVGVVLLQFIVFSLFNFAIPSMAPILFQVGTTLTLFPILYVVLAAITAVLQRVKLS